MFLCVPRSPDGSGLLHSLMPCLYKCICAQEERIAPLYSSASQYTMSEQEENIVRLLRNALQEGSVQDAGGTYMRQIRDLDPPTWCPSTRRALRVPTPSSTSAARCAAALHPFMPNLRFLLQMAGCGGTQQCSKCTSCPVKPAAQIVFNAEELLHGCQIACIACVTL